MLRRSAFALLGCLFISTATPAATTRERATSTYKQITAGLRESQHNDGAWAGVIDADGSVDLMPLVLSKKLGLSYPDLESQTLERIFKLQDSTTGSWSEVPGGPPSLDVTGSILYTLKYLDVASSDPRLARAWSWFNSKGGSPESLSAGNRLIGVFGEWLERGQFPLISPKILALTKSSPINIHNIGFTRIAVIPYSIWCFFDGAMLVHRKVRPLDSERVKSRGSLLGTHHEARLRFEYDPSFAGASGLLSHLMTLAEVIPYPAEFWAQEGIGWILDHQQADGTWAGALQMTYFSILALHKAQLAGVGNFDSQIQKAWQGLMAWRAKIPEGSTIQQSTVGPVMDTARVLSAIHAAPKSVSDAVLPGENRSKAVRWLLDHQIAKKGDWSNMVPGLPPGGWTFEYVNDFYPDCDDTAMVIEGLAMSDLTGFPDAIPALRKGVAWLVGMQNKDGGFPAWDRGVTSLGRKALKMLNMPEMSDEGQVDITSRSVKALAIFRNAIPSSTPSSSQFASSVQDACRFLEKQKRKTADGPLRLWRGEWMTNYLYGTSEALGALMAGDCWTAKQARPYVEWLMSKQQNDGGWGESQESYDLQSYVQAKSTLSQSEWVLNALISYERLRRVRAPGSPSVMPAIENGIGFLIDRIGDRKQPYESEFTGTFVRGVWYSRYVSLAHYEGVRTLGNYLSLAER